MAECRSCREEIKPGATRCRHCHAYQSRWSLNPGSPRTTWLMVVPLLFMAFLWFPLRELSRLSEDPADIARTLEITHSELRHSTDENGRRYVAIVGRVRNRGSVSIDGPHFAVRFLNADGELIDAHSGSDHSLIVAPGKEQAFTLYGYALEPESAYADHEIEVTGAARARVF